MDILAFLCDAERSGSYVEKTLIAAIVTNPEDEIAVKAYGDYLEEHNRTLAAMIVRSEGFCCKIKSIMDIEGFRHTTDLGCMASGSFSTLRIPSGAILPGPYAFRSGQIGFGSVSSGGVYSTRIPPGGFLPPNETTSRS